MLNSLHIFCWANSFTLKYGNTCDIFLKTLFTKELLDTYVKYFVIIHIPFESSKTIQSQSEGMLKLFITRPALQKVAN